MHYIKYFFLLFILIYFTACNTTTPPKKEEPKEDNVTKISPLGELSPEQKVVKQALDDYLTQLSTFNTDAIVDMTYPKLFQVIDLDLFRQYIASMMNSTKIEMLSYDTNITKLSKVTTFSNETKFAQAEYTSILKIHFLSEELYNTDEKINFLYDALIHKYGTENIQINKEERTLQITKQDKLLIIKEKDTEWKFLGDNIKYRTLYPDFLPTEILNMLDPI